MSVANDLFLKLYSDATLGNLLDKYTSNNYPAIFNDPICPVDFTGQEHITMYRTSNIDRSIDYIDQVITVNCRGANLSNALAIKDRVIALINRQLIAIGSFGTVSELPAIRPQDETDNYNCPLEIRIKSKEA